MEEGDRDFVALSWTDDEPPLTYEDAAACMRRTADFWRGWLNHGAFPDHPWRGILQRSALTLKGLTYAPTGALLAAGCRATDDRGTLHGSTILARSPRSAACTRPRVVINRPDIVILEGLNVLQTGNHPTEFVSDYFDFSIYLDAEEDDIERWYIDRFLTLRASVFQDPRSFFRRYADLDDDEAVDTARGDLAEHQRAQPARRTSAPTASGPR